MAAHGRIEPETETVEQAASACVAESAAPDAKPVGRKCEQLLDGARAVILARGFEGASVDDIAREAGISKATMYRYYPDKSALFAAVMHRDCERQSETMLGFCTDGRPLETVLTELATRHLEFVLSPCALGSFRTAVHESERFPEIGQAFYASAVDRKRAWLAPLLAAACERGELKIDDADLAAHRFFLMTVADVFFKRLLGIGVSWSEAQIAARASEVAAAFMRTYRPD